MVVELSFLFAMIPTGSEKFTRTENSPTLPPWMEGTGSRTFGVKRCLTNISNTGMVETMGAGELQAFNIRHLVNRKGEEVL